MTSRSIATTTMTIGLDVGDRASALCILDAQGAVLARETAATTTQGLGKALRGYPHAQVVLEVGTHSPWVSRWLSAQGHPVLVANPWRVRRIAALEDKSDAIDAELLARLGRSDPQLLRPIVHRGEAAQRDRAVLRVRDELVRTRTALITQARGLAKALGARLPRCNTEAFARRMAEPDYATLFPGMPELCAAVGMLTTQVAALDRVITQVARARYPVTQQLRQVAGVGPITALGFVVTLEDPTRFRRSRDVGAYVGLRPRRYQSGTRDPALHISKAGDPFLRRTLVQAAQHILGPHGPDTALRRFGLRVVARGGRSARKRAVIAVARKLAVLLHRLWVSGERYEPLRGLPTPAATA